MRLWVWQEVHGCRGGCRVRAGLVSLSLEPHTPHRGAGHHLVLQAGKQLQPGRIGCAMTKPPFAHAEGHASLIY